MKRFVEGANREQATLFPECLEDYVGDDNPVRVIDVFVDQLDLGGLGFSGVDPAIMLKLYVYGYFNSLEILACEQADITITLPKPQTSGRKAKGRFVKADRYEADKDVYVCPLLESRLSIATRMRKRV